MKITKQYLIQVIKEEIEKTRRETVQKAMREAGEIVEKAQEETKAETAKIMDNARSESEQIIKRAEKCGEQIKNEFEARIRAEAVFVCYRFTVGENSQGP